MLQVSSNAIVVLLVSLLVPIQLFREYVVTGFTLSPVIRHSSPAIISSSVSCPNHQQRQRQRHYPILQSTTTETTDTTVINYDDTVTKIMNTTTTTTIPEYLSKAKLDEILCTFNSSAVNEVLLKVNLLRKQQQQQQSNNNDITTVLEKYLNNIILLNGQENDDDELDPMTISTSAGSNNKLPFWSNVRLLTRFSKRARLASFQRTIDLLTPPSPEQYDSDGSIKPGSSTNENNDENDILRRKRRALVQLLQSLATTTRTDSDSDTDSTKLSTSSNESRRKKRFQLPAITVLEKRAKESLKVTNFDELVRRRPTGLESPDYTVVVPANIKNKICYEIRQYNPYSVCTVVMNQPRPSNNELTDAKISEPKLSGASSFGALAGYLFGKNQQGIAMKMTTPVLTTTKTSTKDSTTDTNMNNNNNNNNKEMSFILPSTYWNTNGTNLAPQPIIGSGVTLHYAPQQYKAVVMFGGYATTSEVIKNKQLLVSSLLQNTNWEPIIINSSSSSSSSDDEKTTNNNYNNIYDSVILAQYNDPFTPPWKRLNEVSITVQPKS